MSPKQYSGLVKLSDVSEAQKAILLAFFLLKTQDVQELALPDLCKVMVDFGLSNPNQTRLRKNSVFSRAFMKGTGNTIKLRLKTLQDLEGQYPELSRKSEDIIADETVLPEALYSKTRGYLVVVCRQINASFQHNLFDGCALLMRRLIEMLIILTYRELGREDEIKSLGGGYQPLSAIIQHASHNKVLSLTKGSQDTIDVFRQLGNYSAHTLEYHCRKVDIERVKIPFRVCVEELLYRCGQIK